MLSAVCFLIGWLTGVISYWIARKIYWYVKTPRYVRRHLSTLRYRRRLSVALRHRRYYPVRPIRSYTGYNSDYWLSKLFEKLDQQDND